MKFFLVFRHDLRINASCFLIETCVLLASLIRRESLWTY